MPDDSPARTGPSRVRLVVSGTVQGVGFRPYVHRLATALRLAGSVQNAAAGVVIELEGSDSVISRFEQRLAAEAPAASCITGVDRVVLSAQGARQFAIAPSAADGPCTTLPPPDQATCRDCVAELFDPGARHFRHPFVACAACGPRFSVIAALPYDRDRTAMADFFLCPACQREYGDAAGRRFHAETISCPVCGPRLSLVDVDGALICDGDDAVHRVAELLRKGKIAAVKGIGGYHLMARADDAAVVQRLRERKRRPTKPFAVMFSDIAAVTAACEANGAERDALGSAAAPIVLLHRRDAAGIADTVAPGNPRFGAMLPYAPLHHLLLRDLAFPLVATSFNRSGDQLVFRDDAALAGARDLADAVLTHDRAILRPVEDSVLQVVAGAPMVLRLGRGFAPLPVPLRGKVPPLLALGGHLKNAPAITVAAQAVLAPQLGDLDDPATLQAHRATVQDLCALHGISPVAVACDAHPDYATTEEAEGSGKMVIRVQHHLAHVAAAMAEHELDGPVLGIAWDGTGYGDDGTVWGGEMLVVEGARWRRFARLHPFRLPGGDAAAREPDRSAVGVVAELFGTDPVAWPAELKHERTTSLLALCRSGVNAPLTSSAGRLFDAVAALLGIIRYNSFEGEAAIALESLAARAPAAGAYPVAIADGKLLELDWRPAIRALLHEVGAGVAAATVAARFHDALVHGAVALARRSGLPNIVLTGGCFQSWLLTERMSTALRAAGLNVFSHHRVPPGDGGLALGQLEWARRVLGQ